MKKKLIPRFFTPPKKQSYFLFGPRGTGKSHTLKYFYPGAVLIDFLDDATLLRISNDTSRIEALILAGKKGDVFIFDEIQKVPQLLAKIHQIIESKNFPEVQFIMTGSSARKLKKSGADLLGGRALVTTMHPFLASELGPLFKLENNLELGLLPVVIFSENPKQTLNSYISVYLREEVKQEGLVRNLEAFSRFLEVMSFSHGEILNLSNVARESSIKRSTVDGYLEILEDLLLGYRIPPFKKRNRKNTIDTDKFYFFDAGVFNSLRPKGVLDDNDSRLGHALEGLVLQNLRAWVSYRHQNEDIYFWQTQAGNEVDFIVYGPKTFLAIEVKNSNKINTGHLSGLKSFSADYPEAKCILLFRGTKPEKHGAVECLPVTQFLMSLK